ncbi:MAG TPA: NHL repeat-containing protein [Thermoanaerobaculia bacterium]
MKKSVLLALILISAVIACRKADESGRAANMTPAPRTVVAPEKILGVGAGLKEPRGIGVDANGQIFVGDSGNQRIVRLDPTGKVLGSWGSWAAESVIADVAVTADNQVATLNVNPGDVQVFKPDGTPVLRLPGVATNSSGISTGPDGRIWVADTGQSRVLRFTSDGKPDGVFTGATDSAHPPFDQPIDVAVAPDGTVYVVDLRSRIMRLAADGRISAQWAVEHGRARGGSHLAFWRGLIVMTDPDRGRLTVLDPATGGVRFVGETGTLPGQFAIPVGISAGRDDKLYVVDSGNARVQVFDDLRK